MNETDSQQDTDGPPYYVKYRVYDKADESRSDRAHIGEKRTFEGFYNEPSPVECVNAIVYGIRGGKSRWELAYVDEITPIENHESG